MSAVVPACIEAVRHFNRFYTRRIGVLQEGLLQSPFSLTEVRVLYEIAHREGLTATDLGRELELDAGYLSRILKRFEKRGLLRRVVSKSDARRSHLALTAKGRRTLAPLEAASNAEVGAMLAPLPEAEQQRVVEAMRLIERRLSGAASQEEIVFREHRPGDMGWVISRHGALYAQEYQWTQEFEALVAEICAQFIRNFDPEWERCWIAERAGERVGCVFVVKESPEVARLRMLLVEPSARGCGLGRALVRKVIEFARSAGYQKIVLWTNSILHAARHIYEAEGFRLVREEPHHNFGHQLIGQHWALSLQAS